MFGRKKTVKIQVPGTPVVVVEEAANRQETEETLKHNAELEEANIDKTVADSFPASDPPSTVPETKEDPNGKKRAA